MKGSLLILCCLLSRTEGLIAQIGSSVNELISAYSAGVQELEIPAFTYDYRSYLRRIPGKENLMRQVDFFTDFQNQIQKLSLQNKDQKSAVKLDHMAYECAFHIQRLQLEMAWQKSSKEIQPGGLYYLPHHKDWYAHFIQKSTTLQLSPDDIMSFGKQEVDRINHEINLVRTRKGFESPEEMYQALQDDAYYLSDKNEINLAFHSIDSIARSKLKSFVGLVEVPNVYPMEWPGAGSHTPPGIYLNRSQNSLGRDVFQYNFFDGRFNTRMLEWLYIHEAIPGHHLQASIRAKQSPDDLQSASIYPGNFEGWACYAEYQCRELGMFQEDMSYLGWLEWELVRSVRLVLEAGIHARGWSKERALEYWKENIYGQDHIADREITRVSNWPGQALSYKMGARFLDKLFKKYQDSGHSVASIHAAFLKAGMRPLPVIQSHFDYYLTTS